MKYLLAYKINGQIVSIDIPIWNAEDLNGNQPFKIISSGTTIPSGYTNISSIEYWNTFGTIIANDYLVCKNEIKTLVTQKGWSNMTNAEKDVAIQYYSYPSAVSATTYLVNVKGYSVAQAFLIQQWHKHHGNLVNSCKQRWYYVKLVIATYLLTGTYTTFIKALYDILVDGIYTKYNDITID